MAGSHSQKKEYRDYGYLREEDIVDGGAVVASGAPPADIKRSKRPERSFPSVLHYMLSDLEKDGKSDIMEWMPHGRSFIVRDQQRMESEVLPL
jgi:hypothetical protein